jgi:hypothetical protein
VLGMAATGAEAPRETPGETAPDVALPPGSFDEAPVPEVVFAAEVTPPALLAVVPELPVLAVPPGVVPPLVAVPPVVAVLVAAVPEAGEVTGEPLAVPALAEGGAAVAVTTPQVGVVCPAATSAGVRSPQE